MIRMIENIGYKALSRLVPTASASAYNCLCEANSWWRSMGKICYCTPDCKSVKCYWG
ncbi:hypothetical protein F4558_005516 [Micromonospora profundi]|nr:hypothetical protein [Micromonospora profundi]